jgi:hypothetical protein
MDKQTNMILLGELPLVIQKEEVTPEQLDFLLGSRDREMDRIQELCKLWGLSYRFATCNGVRVNPDNAYQADAVKLSPGRVLVLVECEPKEFVGDIGLFRRIDHHRPIDSGYHMAPEFYWQASSIGQFYALLGLGLPAKEDLVIAARDHCLFAAMQGKCPGVTPEEAESQGEQSFAKENGVHLSYVRARMNQMLRAIQMSPKIIIGNQVAIDFRHCPTGIANSLDDLIARQLLAARGQAGLIRCKNQPDDPDKVMMCGATPEAIEDFRMSWGPQHGLSRFFYVVARRYVGGFDIR